MSSRLERILDRLQALYGPLTSPPSDAFTLFVCEILSNHSTPKKRSTSAYRRAYTYLAHHGAETFGETNPRCDECPVIDECPFGKSRARRRV
jgi:endonuclease III